MDKLETVNLKRSGLISAPRLKVTLPTIAEEEDIKYDPWHAVTSAVYADTDHSSSFEQISLEEADEEDLDPEIALEQEKKEVLILENYANPITITRHLWRIGKIIHDTYNSKR